MLDSLRNRMFEALPDHASVKVLIEGEADWLTLNVVNADVVGVAFESEGAAISCYPWRSIRALTLDHLSASSRPPSAK